MIYLRTPYTLAVKSSYKFGLFGLGRTGASMIGQWTQERNRFSQYPCLDTGNLDLIALDLDFWKNRVKERFGWGDWWYDIWICVMGLEELRNVGTEPLWQLAGLLQDSYFKIALVYDSEKSEDCFAATHKESIYGQMKTLNLPMALIHIPPASETNPKATRNISEKAKADILQNAIKGILGFFDARCSLFNHNMGDLRSMIPTGLYHLGMGRGRDMQSSFTKALASALPHLACLSKRERLLYVTLIPGDEKSLKYAQPAYAFLEEISELMDFAITSVKQIEHQECNFFVDGNIGTDYVTVMIIY